MKLGVMSAGLASLGWEKALDFCQKLGLDAIELPCGAYPGRPYFDPEVLLRDAAAQRRIVEDCKQHGLTISALAVHGNPVDPDPDRAGQAGRGEQGRAEARQLGHGFFLLIAYWVGRAGPGTTESRHRRSPRTSIRVPAGIGSLPRSSCSISRAAASPMPP